MESVAPAALEFSGCYQYVNSVFSGNEMMHVRHWQHDNAILRNQKLQQRHTMPAPEHALEYSMQFQISMAVFKNLYSHIFCFDSQN